MRLTALLVLAAACGSSNKSTPKDGKVYEGGPTVDGPPLLACTAQSGTTISMRMIGQVANGQDAAIIATSPPNDGRLFVIQQGGQIRIFDNEQLRPTEFLDMSSQPGFVAGGEQGLLGLAFHPDYAHNNYFYVWYTTGPCNGSPPVQTSCTNVLARYTTSSTDLNKADPNSAKVILTVPDFATNHNAGMIEFGPDGYLYISTGDGGAGGDPLRSAQDTSNLLGKILRIDVDNPANGKEYGIPSDNPFGNEVWMYGLRNPWRWSFDKASGDMWIADVGQNIWEELDYIPRAQQKGANMGWSIYEATHCYGNYTCPATGTFMPQWEVNHNQGWVAIIGGQVYRGPCYPDLTGYYFYTDYAAHALYRTKPNGSGIDTPVDVSPAGGFPTTPSSLHADARGELYLTSTDGYVYHLEAGP